MSEKFLTLSETARNCGVPVSRLQPLVASGTIVPAGRAGSSANSPILFLAADLPAIRSALHTGSKATANRPHNCGSVAEVREKHAAFVRAASEAGK